MAKRPPQNNPPASPKRRPEKRSDDDTADGAPSLAASDGRSATRPSAPPPESPPPPPPPPPTAVGDENAGTGAGSESASGDLVDEGIETSGKDGEDASVSSGDGAVDLPDGPVPEPISFEGADRVRPDFGTPVVAKGNQPGLDRDATRHLNTDLRREGQIGNDLSNVAPDVGGLDPQKASAFGTGVQPTDAEGEGPTAFDVGTSTGAEPEVTFIDDAAFARLDDPGEERALTAADFSSPVIAVESIADAEAVDPGEAGFDDV